MSLKRQAELLAKEMNTSKEWQEPNPLGDKETTIPVIPLLQRLLRTGKIVTNDSQVGVVQKFAFEGTKGVLRERAYVCGMMGRKDAIQLQRELASRNSDKVVLITVIVSKAVEGDQVIVTTEEITHRNGKKLKTNDIKPATRLSATMPRSAFNTQLTTCGLTKKDARTLDLVYVQIFDPIWGRHSYQQGGRSQSKYSSNHGIAKSVSIGKGLLVELVETL